MYFAWVYGFMMNEENDIIKQHLGMPKGDEKVGATAKYCRMGREGGSSKEKRGFREGTN